MSSLWWEKLDLDRSDKQEIATNNKTYKLEKEEKPRLVKNRGVIFYPLMVKPSKTTEGVLTACKSLESEPISKILSKLL